ncbi:MAG TPA: hypothetical protein PJ986_10565 [Gammaproteobacteria bacterium]|nr:hypothetical protein [Gammaproteobacteria bacterium]
MKLDFSKAIPGTTIAHLSVGDVEISPLRLRQITPLLAALAAIEGEFVSVEAFEQLDAEGWLRLLRTSGDDFVPVLAILTGLTADEIGMLTPDDVLELATVAIEVNASFFFERVGPKLTGSIERLARLTGSTSSSD